MTTKIINLRLELVTLANKEGANVAQLCRRFGISRRTAYKWMRRYGQGESSALADRSRRPRSSPRATPPELEKAVVDLRAQHPAWGPRKLKRRLEDLGVQELPARSTMGALLRRRGLIDAGQTLCHRPVQRFARARPNELWQLDFKGDFALSRGGRCHPLPILDDHSRFLLGLFACANQQDKTVRWALSAVFERYGLPEELLCDNGGPWAGSGGDWTRLGVWLLRQGIRVCHGRPYHPQTQGKEERFNRTLKAEVLARQDLRDLPQAQAEFERWRTIYNCQRPHEALQLEVPATRYSPSPRSYRAQFEEITYGCDDEIRRVKSKGEITWRNRTYLVGAAFAGEPVALRRTRAEHLLDVYYCHQWLGQIDLRLVARSKHHYLRLNRSRTYSLQTNP